MSDGIDPVLKLTPSLSKYSASIPGVPFPGSWEHWAETEASKAEAPSFLTSVCVDHSKESPEESVGKVESQCLDPLEYAESDVSNPPFGSQFEPQLPSFEPQDA